jgi:gliding motility-associated-like protein
LEGYGVAPNLPAGLTFAGTTGTISGTPANVAPAAIYTVTAENASGVSIFPISISIDNPVAAQAPVISYTGPQTYVAGTAISTLAPTNTGGAVPAAVYAQVTTFAGSGAQGTTNGTGTVASFNNPFALTTDASGNIYVADQRNQLIREITPGGAVTTLAGSGATGAANGAGTAASFNNPSGVAVDASGNVYVGDQTNNLIRKITSAGVVTTFAGSSTHGFVNGTGTAASFNGPTAVAIDNSGNVYVADNGNYAIRKITPAGVVTTLAGSGTLGSANGTGTAASFNNPSGLAVDASGNVYVADQNNQLIRKITPAGVVSTFAGSGTAALVNGTGTAASFDYPIGLTIDPAGNLYVGDYVNQVIRMITPAGVVTTLAGTAGTSGALNGVGTTASFNNPFDVAADKDGNLYVADKSNSLIRKINLTGYTIAPAIGGLAFDGTTGIISGTAKVIFPTTTFSITAYNTAGSSVASLTVTVNPATVNAPVISYAGPQSYPVNTAITTLSPTNTGGAIPVTSSTAVSTFAGSGASGSLNGNGLAATFKLGQGNLAIDNSGNVYVADDANFIVRKITPAGVVTTLAGNGVSGTVDGTGTTAGFGSLRGIAVDPSGNVYVTDYNLLRKITPSGVVTTFAGGGPTINGSSVDGTGTAASFFSSIFGLASDASGNIYVAEPNDGKIRKVTPAGVVTTIISNNSSNALRLVFGLTVDASGNIYGACSFDNVIIKVTQAGVMTIIAGIENSTGSQNGVASTSTFYWPSGITIDASGNLFVAEFGDNLIREISTANIVSTYAGNTLGGLGNSTPVASYFSLPQNLEIDAAGNKYIFDAGNDMIRKIGLTGYTISPALPAGLIIDPNTGVISGTPTVITAATNYTVTAYNSGGTATTVVNIATPTAALAPLNVQTYGAPDFSPQKSKNVVVTYSSDNPAVATIVRGKIHITGVGTSTITTLINGTQQLQTLKVVPAQLIIAINNKVKQEGAAIPKLTVDYAGFVNGETEDVLTAKPIVVTDAQEGSGAGEYLIKADGAVAPNYEIAYLPGRLTVTPISANNPSQVSVTNEQQDFLVLNEPNVKQAVSPNGDGINDVLLIDNIASFPDNKLVLIGRNGNKIFELEHYDNVNHPFDGRSNINGQLQAPGTYYYLLEYHDKGVLKQKTGFFVLKY